MLKAIIQTLRLNHWVKNLFVFAPLVFAKRLFDFSSFAQAAIGFILFSLAASAAYIFNDICDVENDRRHPIKRLRPIAAGKLTVSIGLWLFLILGLVSGSISYIVKPSFGMIVTAYIILNVLYSIILKYIIIADVLVIATGFVLRVLAGAQVVAVPASIWLIACTAAISLLLAAGKRLYSPESKSPVLKYLLMMFIAIPTVILYVSYTMDAKTIKFFGTKYLVLTVPFVIYGIFRYLSLVIKKKNGDDPTEILLSDLPMMINIVLWIIICILIIYGT
ncbi:MAG: UbiA prenyltransferase family protein [Planctomycetes bacterium]|nr:UbiA prenyltransferase family protein [Planctomycetota bacterium]